MIAAFILGVVIIPRAPVIVPRMAPPPVVRSAPTPIRPPIVPYVPFVMPHPGPACRDGDTTMTDCR